MPLKRGLSLHVLLALLILGCTGGQASRAGLLAERGAEGDPTKKRGADATTGEASSSASAAPSSGPAASSPPSQACPDPAPPIPTDKGRASFVLQDGHTSTVIAVELSANGRLLASTGLDGTVRLWDTKTGLQLRRISTQGASLTTSLAASGDTLAFIRSDTGGQGATVATVALDVGADPKPLDTFGNFRLSADGKMLAVGWEELSIVDPRTGAKLRTMKPFQPPARAPAGAKLDPAYKYSTITAAAFDESGSRLAVASGLELAIIDTSTWKVLVRKAHGMGVPAGSPGGPPAPRSGAAPPPSSMPNADPKVIQPGWFPSQLILRGDALVLVSSMGTRVVSAKDGGSPRSLPGYALSAAVLGDVLLTTDALSRVSAWRLSTGAPAEIPGLERLKGQRLSASADGSTIAIAALSVSTTLARSGLMDLRIYDARTMRLIRVIEPRLAVVEGVAVSPDGSELAVASRGGSLSRWSLLSGELKGTTKGSPGFGHWQLTYDDAGEMIAVMNGTRHVRVNAAKSGRILRQWEPTGQPVILTWFTPGKKELGALDAAGSITTWDLSPSVAPQPPVDRGAAVIAKPSALSEVKMAGPVTAAAISPDRLRIAALTGDRTITTPDPTGRLKYRDVYTESSVTLVDVSRGSALWSTKIVSGYLPKWVGFAPDGKTPLVSSMDDTRGMVSPTGQMVRAVPDLLRVFDATSGALVRSEKMSTSGPMAASGTDVAIGGRAPVILAWPSLVAQKVAAPDYMVGTIAALPQRSSFIFGGDSGGSTLAKSTGAITTILASAMTGEYVTAALDGVFRSNVDGASRVAWAFGGPLEGFSFEQFAARFSRPDIVAARLAGKEAAAPGVVTRPPVVSLERPSSGAPLLTKTARVRGRVESTGRVDRARVFVNGRAAAEVMVCAPRGDVDVEVPVSLGRSRLTVIAYDADGFASNPESFDVTSAAESSSRPDLWVVSVGVSRYKNLPPQHQLEFADDDARSIADALAAEVGPGRPFGALHATSLIDADVSVASVQGALASLSKMGPDDLAFVFLAGHGVALEEGKMVYLTSGASMSREGAREHGIGWDLIGAELARARGRVVVLLDACHSGHVSTELIAPNESLAKELSAEGRSGVLVFAAARGSQLSYEVAPERAVLGGSRGLELAWEGKPAQVASPLAGGHGLFTSAVLEALSGQATDADRSGAVEASELIDYVTDRVREASNGQQTPWVARREMFGDFFIAPAQSR